MKGNASILLLLLRMVAADRLHSCGKYYLYSPVPAPYACRTFNQ
jgi:hypothetical protein